MGVACPADIDFESFDHDVSVNRGVRLDEYEAQFVVAAEWGALGEIDFVSDVWWDVHAWIPAFRGNVDVGLAALDDCFCGDR